MRPLEARTCSSRFIFDLFGTLECRRWGRSGTEFCKYRNLSGQNRIMHHHETKDLLNEAKVRKT